MMAWKLWESVVVRVLQLQDLAKVEFDFWLVFSVTCQRGGRKRSQSIRRSDLHYQSVSERPASGIVPRSAGILPQSPHLSSHIRCSSSHS